MLSFYNTFPRFYNERPCPPSCKLRKWLMIEKQGIYFAWPNHNYGNIRLTLHVLSTINVDDRPSEEVGHASRAPQ